MKPIRDAISHITMRSNLAEDAQDAILKFADALLAFEEKYKDPEAGLRARLLWLRTSESLCTSPRSIAEVLSDVDAALKQTGWDDRESDVEALGVEAKNALYKYIDEVRRFANS